MTILTRHIMQNCASITLIGTLPTRYTSSYKSGFSANWCSHSKKMK